MVWDIENFFKHLSNDKDGGVKDCEVSRINSYKRDYFLAMSLLA